MGRRREDHLHCEIAGLCQRRKKVIVDTFDSDDSKEQFLKDHKIEQESVRFRISDAHGCIVNELVNQGLDLTILMTGGDTLMGYMKQIGCTQIEPICEIEQGVVVSKIKCGGHSIQVISKSGGFGTVDILCRIAEKVLHKNSKLKGERIMKKVELKGIITPILTPMKADESMNTEELRAQIERLIDGGVHGIFPFGTNGEGYILSENEKVEVLEATIDQVKGRVPVYAGSGCISTADTIRMSRKAEELGADVLSIITPSFAVASQKELYDHYVEVAKHVDTPIVLYNIPARTGNKLLPQTVARLARDVDIIVGAKDSSGDWENLKAYIHQTQDLDKDFFVLSGNDSLILPALKEGGTGGIAGCSNVYPHVLSSIYNLFKEGKLEDAQAAQDSIASFRAVFKYGNPNTVVKKAVAMLGYPVGDCRRPFNYLCDEGVEALKRVLKENADKGMN